MDDTTEGMGAAAYAVGAGVCFVVIFLLAAIL